MKSLIWGLICVLGLFVSGCEAEVQPETETEESAQGGTSATLSEVGGAATLDDCPNGGVTIEHGIDGNQNGKLDSDEVTDTYALCNGRDGVDGSVGDTAALEARIAELEQLVATLQSAVDANTAKVGFPGFGTEAGLALEGDFTESDPVASAAGYIIEEKDPVASAAGYLKEAFSELILMLNLGICSSSTTPLNSPSTTKFPVVFTFSMFLL